MNTLEIIREMRQDPALAEELRAVVLSRELLKLPEVVAELSKTVAELSKTVAYLLEVVKRHEDDLGQLKGFGFETKWNRDGTAYLGSRGFRKARLIVKDDLAELVDDAPDEVRDDVMLADAVHSATRKDDGSLVYIVAEVSVRMHRDDVERANRRAGALSSFTGKDCVAVVVGASIDTPADDLAKQYGVIVVIPKGWTEQAA
ncbi:MAG: hypothetical protein ACYDGY_07895 [Acidimicrobiales bacterium]